MHRNERFEGAQTLAELNSKGNGLSLYAGSRLTVPGTRPLAQGAGVAEETCSMLIFRKAHA